MIERGGNQERERERERREKVRARERSPWREREYRESKYVQGDAGLRVRREGRRRGSRVAQMPQTRGSRPAFKSGHEENADADVGSASR